MKAGKAAREKAKKEYDWSILERRWIDLANVFMERK